MNNLFKRTIQGRTYFFYWNGDLNDILRGTFATVGRVDFVPDGL